MVTHCSPVTRHFKTVPSVFVKDLTGIKKGEEPYLKGENIEVLIKRSQIFVI